ncbi:MAG TPA: hypothetical protein PKW90_25155, partial [Myxococcota bacterium]|nr:hypothetical protein [Myxococcota bacterium]
SLAFAAELSVDQGVLIVDGRRWESGAPVLAAVEQGGQLYVLRADERLELWNVDGTKLGELPLQGAAGLFVAGGRVWVEQREIRALPLDVRAFSTAPPAGMGGVAPAAPAAPSESAVVLHVQSGLAEVEGRRETGTELRFLGSRGEGGQREVGRGRVVEVGASSSTVELDRGSVVQEGDQAENERRERNHYPIAPPRHGLVELGLILRPFLALDKLGVGSANVAWAPLVFEKPWYLSAQLSPLAVGGVTSGPAVNIAGTVSGGYETQYFSVGLGGGGSTLGPTALNADARELVPAEDIPAGVLTITQEARLGARDGLHVSVRNFFLLVPAYSCVWNDYYYGYSPTGGESGCTRTGQEFTYGGIGLDLQVPVGIRTDIVGSFTTTGSGVLA